MYAHDSRAMGHPVQAPQKLIQAKAYPRRCSSAILSNIPFSAVLNRSARTTAQLPPQPLFPHLFRRNSHWSTETLQLSLRPWCPCFPCFSTRLGPSLYAYPSRAPDRSSI